MTTDLTPPQTVNGTDNPQAAQGAVPTAGASDASSFQKSAGIEVLNGKKEITVANNGQPVTAVSSVKPNAGAIILLIVIAVVAIAAGVYVYRLTGRTSKTEPEPEIEPKKSKKVPAVPVTITRPAAAPKSKKKQPRSKRNK